MEKEHFKIRLPVRISMIGFAITALFMVYLLQGLNYVHVFNLSANATFVANRSIRLIINDTLCMVLIVALFQKRSYLRLAGIIFLIELFLILPVYLLIKLSMEGPSEISSPLLSPIHRMIVNPLLMIILIAALYYQRYISSSAK
jgi:exosortase F-associated protein